MPAQLSLAYALTRKGLVRWKKGDEGIEMTLFEFLDLPCERVPQLAESLGELQENGIMKLWQLVAFTHEQPHQTLNPNLYFVKGASTIEVLNQIMVECFDTGLGVALDRGLCAALEVTSETKRTSVIVDLLCNAQMSRSAHELAAAVDDAFIAGLRGKEAERMSIAPEVVRLANARGLELWRTIT